MKGMFIVIEGMDGTGKTSQTERLVETLRREGYTTLQAREPGGTEAGEDIRTLVKSGKVKAGLTELLLFNASRAELMETVIVPALEAGTIVVSDRFTGSTIAYQGYGRGIPIEAVRTANELATKGTEADVTILLTASTQTASIRREGRTEAPDRFERESQLFTERVAAGYLAQADDGWVVIDTERDRDTVAREIWEQMQVALRLRQEPQPNPQGGDP